MKPLSNSQKAALAQIARAGWSRQVSLALTGETADAWRAREAIECCGKRISEATARDFEALMSHFLNLAGDTKGAMRYALKAHSAPRTQALWRLDRELERAGLPRSYAETICASVFKCSLTEADPAQVKKVMFTVRHRKAQEARA